MRFDTTRRRALMTLGLLGLGTVLGARPALALLARAYVASQSDGTLRVIEGKSGVGAPIKVSSGSKTNVTDVATSPDGRLVYVANRDENRVYVVDAVNAFTQEPFPVESPDL